MKLWVCENVYTEVCEHTWALLYGMKLIWFVVVFSSCARGSQSCGMISGKVWPLPIYLNLFFKNCIGFDSSFCLMRSKIKLLSHSDRRLLNWDWTLESSLHAGYTTLATGEEFKAYLCLSKSTTVDFICHKHIPWIAPC